MQLRVAHAISPDARYRHPAVRSLDAGLAPQSLLRSASNAVSIGTADPSQPYGRRELPPFSS